MSTSSTVKFIRTWADPNPELLLDPVRFASQFTEEDFRIGESPHARARYLKNWGERPQERQAATRSVKRICSNCLGGHEKHCSDPVCPCVCSKP